MKGDEGEEGVEGPARTAAAEGQRLRSTNRNQKHRGAARRTGADTVETTTTAQAPRAPAFVVALPAAVAVALPAASRHPASVRAQLGEPTPAATRHQLRQVATAPDPLPNPAAEHSRLPPPPTHLPTLPPSRSRHGGPDPASTAPDLAATGRFSSSPAPSLSSYLAGVPSGLTTSEGEGAPPPPSLQPPGFIGGGLGGDEAGVWRRRAEAARLVRRPRRPRDIATMLLCGSGGEPNAA
uniref:Uncharacterized protein n=1 Tax=Oryza rufipogon TaxID=4529 RepID=A0A0E0QIA2_ORYRU